MLPTWIKLVKNFVQIEKQNNISELGARLKIIKNAFQRRIIYDVTIS